MKLRIVPATIAALALGFASMACAAAPPSDQSVTPTPPAGTTQASQDHGDAHAHADGHEQPAPVLAAGQRWATDAPLRAAMSRIREAVALRLPAYHQDALQSADADALAVTVKRDIDDMIANCKLAPEPDAALHVLIGRMMGAMEALHADPASTDGMPQLVSVVNDYQATFDDAGFLPLTHD